MEQLDDTVNDTEKKGFTDPLLEGNVLEKGYSDNLFNNTVKKEEKTEKVKSEDIDKTEISDKETGADNVEKTEIPKQKIENKEVEEKEDISDENKKSEDKNIGKDYDGDGIKSMMDDIDSTSDDEPEEIEEKEKPKIITKEQAESFSKLIGFAVNQIIPPAFVGFTSLFSGIRESKIYEFVVIEKKIPEEFYHNYMQDREDLKDTFTIRPDEIQLIQESFAEFAEEKQLKFVNNKNKFWASLGLVLTRLAQQTIEKSAQMNRRWNKVFEKYGIE